MNSVSKRLDISRLRVFRPKSVDPAFTSSTFSPNSWTRCGAIGDVVPYTEHQPDSEMDETDTICADRRRDTTYGFCGAGPFWHSGPSPRAARRGPDCCPTSMELTSYA